MRGGRATIAIAIAAVPTLLAGRDSIRELIEVGIVVLLVGLGFVSWLVTRWCVDGDDLRIETGVLRRRSLRFPLSQVQAIDVVRPGLARILGLAELRLRMGGSTGGTARLAYLAEHEADPLRDRLLALAAGTSAETEAEDAPPAQVAGPVLVTVPTPRLIASILISDVGVLAEALIVALLVGAVVAPSAAGAFIGSGAAWIVAVFTLVWRRFNQEYRLTVSETSAGLQLSGGLVALTAETIRPGRVQAVRMVEPFLWRRLGWCRLEVDVAGRQRTKGEGREARRALRAVLPVGPRSDADALLARLVPDRPTDVFARPPRRVRWKSPLRYRLLGWSSTETCVSTRSGRLRRVTAWVPLQKVQSLRRVQGPVQRRFRLASLHLDTAGRSVHAVLRDRDVAEADRVLDRLTGLAREARSLPAIPSAVQAG